MKEIFVIIAVLVATGLSTGQKSDSTVKPDNKTEAKVAGGSSFLDSLEGTKALETVLPVADKQIEENKQYFKWLAEKRITDSLCILKKNSRIAELEKYIAWLEAHPKRDTLVGSAQITRIIYKGLQEIPGTPFKKKERALRDVRAAYKIVERIEDDTTGYVYNRL